MICSEICPISQLRASRASNSGFNQRPIHPVNVSAPALRCVCRHVSQYPRGLKIAQVRTCSRRANSKRPCNRFWPCAIFAAPCFIRDKSQNVCLPPRQFRQRGQFQNWNLVQLAILLFHVIPALLNRIRILADVRSNPDETPFVRGTAPSPSCCANRDNANSASGAKSHSGADSRASLVAGNGVYPNKGTKSTAEIGGVRTLSACSFVIASGWFQQRSVTRRSSPFGVRGSKLHIWAFERTYGERSTG